MLPPVGLDSTTSSVLRTPVVLEVSHFRGSAMLKDFSRRLHFGLVPVSDLAFARNRASVWKGRLKSLPHVAHAGLRNKSQLPLSCRILRKDLDPNSKHGSGELAVAASWMPRAGKKTSDIVDGTVNMVEGNLIAIPFASPGAGTSASLLARAARCEWKPLGWSCSPTNSDTVSPFHNEKCSNPNSKPTMQRCGTPEKEVDDAPNLVAQEPCYAAPDRGDPHHDNWKKEDVSYKVASKHCCCSPSWHGFKSEEGELSMLGTEWLHRRMLELELEIEKSKLESLAAIQSAESLRTRVNYLLRENRFLRMAYRRRYPERVPSGNAAQSSSAARGIHSVEPIQSSMCKAAVVCDALRMDETAPDKGTSLAIYQATSEDTPSTVEGLERKVSLYRRELLLLSQQNDALRGMSSTEPLS